MTWESFFLLFLVLHERFPSCCYYCTEIIYEKKKKCILIYPVYSFFLVKFVCDLKFLFYLFSIFLVPLRCLVSISYTIGKVIRLIRFIRFSCFVSRISKYISIHLVLILSLISGLTHTRNWRFIIIFYVYPYFGVTAKTKSQWHTVIHVWRLKTILSSWHWISFFDNCSYLLYINQLFFIFIVFFLHLCYFHFITL